MSTCLLRGVVKPKDRFWRVFVVAETNERRLEQPHDRRHYLRARQAVQRQILRLRERNPGRTAPTVINRSYFVCPRISR
jgi:hypothetical protein